MVVGVIALVLAVTGAAVALPGKNSVDSGDIKNGQVKKNDINKQAKTRWVRVNGDNGNVLDQTGGISADRGEAGVYMLNFGSSVRKYGLLAMASNPAGDQDVIVSATRCGPGPGDQEFCSPASRNNPKWVDVHTVSSSTGHRDSDFVVAAIPR